MTRLRYPLAAGALLVAAACGDDDDNTVAGGNSDDDSTRTIEIDMVDTAFEPADVEVSAGETVRFVFTNTGEVAHDAFIGDSDAQDEHAAEMDEGHDGHGDDSADGDAITVEPGDTGELTHSFEADDKGLLIGCHQPGHFEAGMVITINLT